MTNPENRIAERPDLYTTQEAAETLCLEYEWLKRRAARGEVPHRRLGRYVRFSEGDLRQIIVATKQEAVAPRPLTVARGRAEPYRVEAPLDTPDPAHAVVEPVSPQGRPGALAGPYLFTTRQAAERLNVGYDWLKRRAARCEVPHRRLGRYVRFSEDDIQEIIRNGGAMGYERHRL